MYFVQLSNGDWAEAEDLPSAVTTAEQLARDAGQNGCGTHLLRVTILNPENVCILADVHPNAVRGRVRDILKRHLAIARRET